MSDYPGHIWIELPGHQTHPAGNPFRSRLSLWLKDDITTAYPINFLTWAAWGEPARIIELSSAEARTLATHLLTLAAAAEAATEIAIRDEAESLAEAAHNEAIAEAANAK